MKEAKKFKLKKILEITRKSLLKIGDSPTISIAVVFDLWQWGHQNSCYAGET